MARKRKTTRRRTRRYGPSTRKGQRRITARRAYTRRRPNPRPRRRRRNPRPLLENPAVRYAGWAVAGAASAAYLNTWASSAISTEETGNGTATGLAPLLKPKMGEGRLHAGVVGAAVTIGLSMLPKVKAKTRSNLLALGVGMLTTPVTGFVTTAFKAEESALLGSAQGQQTQTTQQDQIRRFRMTAPANYRASAHYSQATAQFLGVPVS